MRRTQIIMLLLLILSGMGCRQDVIRYKEPELVVEGWIENGRFPVVILTTTIPVNEEPQDLTDVGAYVVRWAKVTLSDGERDVVLVGGPRKRYFPPYIYTTSEMRGECGKTYTLKVEYRNYYAEATTTIPQPARIDSFQVLPVSDSDSLCQVKVSVNNQSSNPRKYYKIFSRIYPEEGYYRSFINSVFTSDDLSSSPHVSVNPGFISGQENYSTFFNRKDTVLIRVASVDSASYHYWRDFEEIVISARNPIFNVHLNIRSNIKGGKGYWCGYGSQELALPLNDYLDSEL